MRKNQKGFGHIEVFLIIVVVGLIVGAGLYIYHHSKSSSSISSSSATPSAIENARIPQISCTTAKTLIKQAIDGDECYEARFNVGSEPIKYVITKQSANYQQQQNSKCTLDCGGSIPITRSDYIVRANGRVQFSLPDWTQPAETDIDELTGCGNGVFNNIKEQDGQKTFVQNNGDIGTQVKAQGLTFTDDHGDKCIVSFNLIQDMTNNLTPTTGLSISQLKVHYELKATASCRNQSGSQSIMYQCYTDQAVMRNDISLCNMTVDPSDLGDGNIACISALAQRNGDPNMCNKIVTEGNAPISQTLYFTDVKNCQKDSQQLKDVLGQPLIVY
jgi:hypothetical protein